MDLDLPGIDDAIFRDAILSATSPMVLTSAIDRRVADEHLR
jgi:hypothetical protein